MSDKSRFSALSSAIPTDEAQCPELESSMETLIAEVDLLSRAFEVISLVLADREVPQAETDDETFIH